MAYVRPLTTTASFVNTTEGRSAFYTVKADLHNRRVTVMFGRLGTMGREQIFTFSKRADARDFVEEVVERRLDHGYVQIA